ncbi:hypothetical protein O6H91_03G082000 [Diphasiastrum complanatum]|uniref:Uncharacterized protein n=2 Tax=Diphasiastrum complanatum TaxID=34168 RepID=A0ACC2E8C6_DIPCM|nr:hypothetical protein O6H91_03G082000 [Diphasiastrum complanatum]
MLQMFLCCLLKIVSYASERSAAMVWKKRLADFHREVVDHATHSKRQHLIILENFRVKMASKAPSKPQWSGELLKQRKVQAFLGRQGKYLEAQELKRYADRLEHEELHATLQTYQAEVGLKEQTLRSKQQNELDVLLQRAAQGRDDLRRKRAKDYQRCHQRHRNIVRELKAMHAQELVSFEQLFGKRVKENRPQNRNSPSSSLSSGDGYSPLNLPDIGDSEVEEAISNVLGFGPTGTS